MPPKRRDLSFKEKIALLAEYDKLPKCSQRQAADKLGVSQPLLCKLLKNRHFCETADTQTQNVNRKRKRVGKCANIEEALAKWFRNAVLRNTRITRSILSEKAKEFAVEFGEDNFVPTEGWLSRWKVRHNIVYKKIPKETADCTSEAAENWTNNVLPRLLEEFNPDAIFNTNETALYFRAMPPDHSIFEHFLAAAEKGEKERVTVTLTCNMTGTIKKPLIVIGKSKNPRCFWGVKNLPVEYKDNSNASMTAEIFKNFLIEWDKELSKNKQKIALILENSTVTNLRLENIKLVFLPSNKTVIVQPMNQGITKVFKALYRNMLHRKVILEYDGSEDIANKITLLEVLHMMANAWYLVSAKTISNCFRKAGFKKSGAVEIAEVNQEMLTSENEQCADLFRSHEFEAWVNIDEDVSTSGEVSVSDIVEEIIVKQTVFVDANADTDENDGEVDANVPKLNEIRNSLHIVRAALDFHTGTTAEDYSAFYNLQNRIEKLIMPNVTF